MQITNNWEERYRNNLTAWEDIETAPATKSLIVQNLPAGCSVLELGCGRGVDSIWLAQRGYRVAACDISETAIHAAEEKARALDLKISFFVADVL